MATPKALSDEKKSPKAAKVVRQVKNWYADRYFSVILQRNFLFFFAATSSVSILIAMILIKNLYEQRGIDPYIIEVDKKTNIMTIVDHKSKEEYTASEVLKDYFIKNYVIAREGYEKALAERDNNITRVMSSKDVYGLYQRGQTAARNMRNEIGRNATVNVVIQSISYLSPLRVDVKFMKDIHSADENKHGKRYFNATIGFNFSVIEMSAEERNINPLGFQVTYYSAQEEKRFEEPKN